MNNDTKISFVMPAYNCENTVVDTVESIIKTNFRNGDELIIVNDGSSDNTQKVLLKLQEKYKEIKLINNTENIGCPATRNIGIEQAKNPLIFNMDADDVLATNSINLLQKYLIKNNADISAFSESRFFQKNIKKVTHKWVTKGGILTLSDFLAGQITPGGNYLYTKASWKKIGGYWEFGKGLHEFWGFTLKQLANGAKLVVLDNSYYFHRYGMGDSLFVRESKKTNEGLIVTTRMIMNFIDMINTDDAKYIQSGENWFENLSKKPIRLKTGEIGIAGYKIVLKQSNFIIDSLKKNKLVQKIYYSYKKTIQKNHYEKEYDDFKNKLTSDRGFIMQERDKKMILGENTESTNFDTHYIYHPAWAARILKETKPEKHTDISSTLTFCSIVSAFIPVEFYDYRPANLKLSGFLSKRADLQDLPFEDKSLDSLSCMHTIEHIGLGRYGDPINPDADLKAIFELKRVLASSGNLLFVVPIGQPKICFNAHRIYSYNQIMNYFSDLTLKEFSLIPDNAMDTGIVKNCSKELSDKQNYGCGLFWFTKK